MRRAPAVLAVAVLLAASVASPVAARQATPGAATPAATTDVRGVVPAALDSAVLAEFDAFVAEQLAAFGVPGAAVAVVQGDETAFAAGYGVREAGGTDPVTAETLMMVGSNTKSMTAVMAATLVDDGFARWDEPVARLLPGFRLADPALTTRVTLADSFCACTGLPRRDYELIFGFNDLTPDALLASLAQIPLTEPFGESFQYSNQMYAVGGYAAARAAGASPNDLLAGYELAMRDRVLGPLGMERSTFSLAEAIATGDYGVPHAGALDGAAVPIRLLADQAFASSVAPAGGLWSSASDMAAYVAMQMGDGVAADGARVVSAENLARTRETRVALPVDTLSPPPLDTAFAGYAMGWGTGSWHGQPLVSHSGSTLGFVSEVAFLPESDLGVVILTNGGPQSGTFAYAVQYRLFELAFGIEPEVGPLLAGVVEQGEAARAAAFAALARVDPAVVAPFAGRYSHPDLGEIVVRVERGRLELDAGTLSSELLAVGRGASYVFADPPLAGGPGAVTFRYDGAGAPEVVLDLPGEELLTYVFTAMPEPPATPVP